MVVSHRPFWVRAHRSIRVILAPVLLVILFSAAVLSFVPIASDLAPAVANFSIANLGGLLRQTHVAVSAGAGSGALSFGIAMALFGLTTTGLWSWAHGGRGEARETVGGGAENVVAHVIRPEELGALQFRIVGRRRLDEPARGDTQETWSIVLESEAELDFRPGDVLRVSPENGGRERPYSIGSSSLVDPRLVVLTLRLHRFLDPNGATNYGRVSGELIRETPLGGLVRGRLQPQPEFRPPEDPMQPIVMIAADWGVAPFPGFLDERDASGWAGPAWLIFGNRHRDGDFLWDERFQAALNDGSLTRLDTAFRHDADDGAQVQDRLREQAAELRRWVIDDGARVYISGRREMTREVEATIAAILANTAAPRTIADDRIRVDVFD